MSGKDETTHLPAGLQHFFEVVLGFTWPEGSEGGLHAISDAWSDYHDALGQAADQLAAAARTFDDAMNGNTADSINDFLTKDLPDTINQLRDSAHDLGKQAKTAAADIQKSKIMMIAMAAMVLATVISLLASIFGSPFVGGVIAAGRTAISFIFKELISKIAQLTFRQVAAGALRFGWTVGKYAAGGAAFMGGLDGGIQVIQIADGNRDDFDWKSLEGSVIGGAIGGAAFGALHGIGGGVANLVTDAVKAPLRQIGELGMAAVQIGGVAATNPIIGAATGSKGNVSDGILGAFGPHGGKHAEGGGGGDHGGDHGGPHGPSALEKLDKLNLDKLTGGPEHLPGSDHGTFGNGNDLPAYTERPTSGSDGLPSYAAATGHSRGGGADHFGAGADGHGDGTGHGDSADGHGEGADGHGEGADGHGEGADHHGDGDAFDPATAAGAHNFLPVDAKSPDGATGHDSATGHDGSHFPDLAQIEQFWNDAGVDTSAADRPDLHGDGEHEQQSLAPPSYEDATTNPGAPASAAQPTTNAGAPASVAESGAQSGQTGADTGRPGAESGSPGQSGTGPGTQTGGQSGAQAGRPWAESVPTSSQPLSTGDSGPRAAEGGPQVGQSAPPATQGGSRAAEGGPQVSQAGPQVAQGGPPATQGGPRAADGGSPGAQPGPQVRQSAPPVTSGGPRVADGGSPGAQPGPQVRQSAPPPTQSGPRVADGGPQVSQPGPRVAEGGPHVNPSTPRATQSGPETPQAGPQTGPPRPQGGRSGPEAAAPPVTRITQTTSTPAPESPRPAPHVETPPRTDGGPPPHQQTARRDETVPQPRPDGPVRDGGRNDRPGTVDTSSRDDVRQSATDHRAPFSPVGPRPDPRTPSGGPERHTEPGRRNDRDDDVVLGYPIPDAPVVGGGVPHAPRGAAPHGDGRPGGGLSESKIEGNRRGAAFVSPEELRALFEHGDLPAGEHPIVVVRGADGDRLRLVRDGEEVLVTPEELHEQTAHLFGPHETVILASCLSGVPDGVAQRFADARGGDVLAPPHDITAGAKVPGRDGAAIVTHGDDGWRLFTPDGLDRDGYDVVNDHDGGRPFDGISAEHPDRYEGGLHLADGARPSTLGDFLRRRPSEEAAAHPAAPEFARGLDIRGVTVHGVADHPDVVRLAGSGRPVDVRVLTDGGPRIDVHPTSAKGKSPVGATDATVHLPEHATDADKAAWIARAHAAVTHPESARHSWSRRVRHHDQPVRFTPKASVSRFSSPKAADHGPLAGLRQRLVDLGRQLNTDDGQARPLEDAVVKDLGELGLLADQTHHATRGQMFDHWQRSAGRVSPAARDAMLDRMFDTRSNPDAEAVTEGLERAAAAVASTSPHLRGAGIVDSVLRVLREPADGRAHVGDGDIHPFDVEVVPAHEMGRDTAVEIRPGADRPTIRIRDDASDAALRVDFAGAMEGHLAIERGASVAEAHAHQVLAEHQEVRRILAGRSRFARLGDRFHQSFSTRIADHAKHGIESRMRTLLTQDGLPDPVQQRLRAALKTPASLETAAATPAGRPGVSPSMARRLVSTIAAATQTIGAGILANRAPVAIGASVFSNMAAAPAQAWADGQNAKTAAGSGAAPPKRLNPDDPIDHQRFGAPTRPNPRQNFEKRTPAGAAQSAANLALIGSVSHNPVNAAIAAGITVAANAFQAEADHVFDHPEAIAGKQYKHGYERTWDHRRNEYTQAAYYTARELLNRLTGPDGRTELTRLPDRARRRLLETLPVLQDHLLRQIKPEVDHLQAEMRERRRAPWKPPSAPTTYDLVNRGVTDGAPRISHNAMRVGSQHTAAQMPSLGVGMLIHSAVGLLEVTTGANGLSALAYGAGWSKVRRHELADAAAVAAWDAQHQLNYIEHVIQHLHQPTDVERPKGIDEHMDPDKYRWLRRVHLSGLADALTLRKANQAVDRPTEVSNRLQYYYKHIPSSAVYAATAGGLGAAVGPLGVVIAPAVALGGAAKVFTGVGEQALRVAAPLYAQHAGITKNLAEARRNPATIAELADDLAKYVDVAARAQRHIAPVDRTDLRGISRAHIKHSIAHRWSRSLQGLGRTFSRAADVRHRHEAPVLSRDAQPPTGRPGRVLTGRDKRAVNELHNVLQDLDHARDPHHNARADLDPARLHRELAVTLDRLGLRREQDPGDHRWNLVRQDLSTRHGYKMPADAHADARAVRLGDGAPAAHADLHQAVAEDRAADPAQHHLHGAAGAVDIRGSLHVRDDGHVKVFLDNGHRFTIRLADGGAHGVPHLRLAPDDLLHAMRRTHRDEPHVLEVSDAVRTDPGRLAEALGWATGEIDGHRGPHSQRIRPLIESEHPHEFDQLRREEPAPPHEEPPHEEPPHEEPPHEEPPPADEVKRSALSDFLRPRQPEATPHHTPGHDHSPDHSHDHGHEGHSGRPNHDVLVNGGDVPFDVVAVHQVAALMGIDLSGVDVHLVRNADDVAYLDQERAVAWTPAEAGGREIYLGPAAFADHETLAATIAHEYKHVEQYREGRVTTTSVHELEAEAHAAERPALAKFRTAFDHQSGDGHAGGHAGGGRHAARPDAARPDAGRGRPGPHDLRKPVDVPRHKPPFSYERMFRDDRARYQTAAQEFERRIGGHYFNDAKTLDAVRSVLVKLRGVMVELAADGVTEPAERAAIQKKVEAVFFRDDKPDSAGQVGTKVSFEQLVREGNVRELMTAAYNAAYFQYTEDHAFTNLLTKVVDAENWDLAERAGIDVGELKKIGGVLKSYFRSGMLGLERWFFPSDGLEKFSDTLLGTGTAILAQKGRVAGLLDMKDVVSSQASRTTLPEEVQIERAQTMDDYAGVGAPLGKFERAYIEQHLGGPDKLKNDTKLPWREGYALHDTTNSNWATQVMNDGYPVIDGVSATTTKMLTVGKLLGIRDAEAEGFLGAVYGWMLPTRDHSMFEIIRGATIAGVEPVNVHPDRPLATDFYRSLPGLDVPTLRKLSADNRLPHETVYMERVKGTRPEAAFNETKFGTVDKAYDQWRQLKSGHVTDEALKDWLDNHGIDPADRAGVRRFSSQLSDAHLVALRVYTRYGHSIMNTAMAAGGSVTGLLPGAAQDMTVSFFVRSHIDSLVDGYAKKLVRYDTEHKAADPLPVELMKVLHTGDGLPTFRSPRTKSLNDWVRAEVAKVNAEKDYRKAVENNDMDTADAFRTLISTYEVVANERRSEVHAEVEPHKESLRNEMQWHADMAYDALMHLPTVGKAGNPVITYRGDRQPQWYSSVYGSSLLPDGTVNGVLSTSRKLNVARKFMAINSGDKPDNMLLAVYKLTGRQARDISAFSNFQTEAEVVLPPGSRTRQVTDAALQTQIRNMLPDNIRNKVNIIILEERP
jgi:hypothetical protein